MTNHLNAPVRIALVLCLGPVSAALAAPAAPAASRHAPVTAEPAASCVTQTMLCGETVMSQLTAQDCQDARGRFYDAFVFSGTSGSTITASLVSNDFEAHLELRDPENEDVAEAEGEDPGDTARIVHTLDRTSPSWRLIAKADDAGDTGSYTLTLQCSGAIPPPPVPEGYFLDPSYPDFQFRVRIGPEGTALAGAREASCQPETVCVSGALPGRSELFLRILGPRPNGFLWPTIVRFTPSRVVVDLRQVSSGLTKTYVLPPVLPGTDDLSGLQDRRGFLP